MHACLSAFYILQKGFSHDTAWENTKRKKDKKNILLKCINNHRNHSKKKVESQNLGGRDRQIDPCKVQVSLVYVVSSQIARATQSNTTTTKSWSRGDTIFQTEKVHQAFQTASEIIYFYYYFILIILRKSENKEKNRQPSQPAFRLGCIFLHVTPVMPFSPRPWLCYGNHSIYTHSVSLTSKSRTESVLYILTYSKHFL